MTDEVERVRSGLAADGYAIVPGVLDAAMLAEVRGLSERRIAAAPDEHFERNRTTGSMLSIADEPGFARLIGLPRTLAILRGLGLGELAWSAGYVISKPAAAPRLFWHQDWLYWTHPVSREAVPHQLFAMYYLVDTDRTNGCLRVIPGSHGGRREAHDRLARAHSPEALAGRDPAHAMFGDMPGEVDVPVRAGDLLLGDSRLLHAAHANGSDASRRLLTLWYHPAYDRLPGPIQTHLTDSYGGALDGWDAEARSSLGCALPYARSGDAPWPICREPVF